RDDRRHGRRGRDVPDHGARGSPPLRQLGRRGAGPALSGARRRRRRRGRRNHGIRARRDRYRSVRSGERGGNRHALGVARGSVPHGGARRRGRTLSRDLRNLSARRSGPVVLGLVFSSAAAAAQPLPRSAPGESAPDGEATAGTLEHREAPERDDRTLEHREAPESDARTLEHREAPERDGASDEPGRAVPTITVIGRAPRPLPASTTLVTAREIAATPKRSAEDALRLVPGLTLVQHGSEGKGHQFFLRGFDALHGTDLELLVEGIPINEWSNIH